MWDIDDFTPPTEAEQFEAEEVERIARNDHGGTVHPDGCDRCGRVRELYHNERTGLALCAVCDGEVEEEADEAEESRRRDERLNPSLSGIASFAHLHNGSWGVRGPASIVREGETVVVTKRSGATSTVVVERVLWSDGVTAVAAIRSNGRRRYRQRTSWT